MTNDLYEKDFFKWCKQQAEYIKNKEFEKLDIINLVDEESYYHQERMRLFNEAYCKLKSNEKDWEQELLERKELEGTLEDGLQKRISLKIE